MSYSAIVTRVKTHPHPNADRLQLADVGGFQVIVGLDVEDGTLGVFFPTDGQLSDEFCQQNDLYPRFDDKGKRVGGGFIDPKHRRVKAQGFRGEKSYGFWVPLSYFDYTGETLVEGQEFTKLGEHEICNKYVNQATRQAAAKRKLHRGQTRQFAMHVDTDQYHRGKNKIQDDDMVTISIKLHGTSHRVGHVYEPRNLGWFSRLAQKLGVPVETHEWKVLHGTRRVVLDSWVGGYYGSDEFRRVATQGIDERLRKGEVVYGEIVGWANPQRPIMNTVSTKELPEIRKKYGDKMTFDYGLFPGVAKFYIYRIVQTTPDGESVELTVPQVNARAKELGFDSVYAESKFFLGDDWYTLESFVEGETDGDDPYGNHIREGVVVRVDSVDGNTFFLKSKSFAFYVLEGVMKATGAVDEEEAS